MLKSLKNAFDKFLVAIGTAASALLAVSVIWATVIFVAFIVLVLSAAVLLLSPIAAVLITVAAYVENKRSD